MSRLWRNSLGVWFCTVLLGSAPLLFDLEGLSYASDAAGVVEEVKGYGCYTYGDEETPTEAKNKALAEAQAQAVKSHRVFVQSESVVKNFELEKDLIVTASKGVLSGVKIEQLEEKGRQVCMTIRAKLSPGDMEDLIEQRVHAKEISQEVQIPALSTQARFDLKVWTNKPVGRYKEGEEVIIYVQSERDAYLKLDYFQADGSVVHLVPNMFREQSFIRGGHPYAFGDDESPEKFIVTAPFGDEAIKAIASLRPFREEIQARELISNSRIYLRGLQKGLRGIRLAAEASVGLTTTEGME